MKKIKIQTGDYVLMDDDIYTNFSNYEWKNSIAKMSFEKYLTGKNKQVE